MPKYKVNGKTVKAYGATARKRLADMRASGKKVTKVTPKRRKK